MNVFQWILCIIGAIIGLVILVVYVIAIFEAVKFGIKESKEAKSWWPLIIVIALIIMFIFNIGNRNA